MNERYGSQTVELAVVSPQWAAAQTVRDLPRQQREKHEAAIAIELLRLKTAYPTQARNFSQQEAEMMNALWNDIFAGVPPTLLHDAVTRFIVTDRKSFFPSPGQIIGVIEMIIKERDDAERARANFELMRRVVWHDELVRLGYNCGNCKWCGLGAEKLTCKHESEPRGYVDGVTPRSTVCEMFTAADGVTLPSRPPEPPYAPARLICRGEGL